LANAAGVAAFAPGNWKWAKPVPGGMPGVRVCRRSAIGAY